MSTVPCDPFLRGLLSDPPWAGSRFPASARKRLPADSVEAARVPASVHLAIEGTAKRVVIGFERRDRLANVSPATKQEFMAVSCDRLVRTPMPDTGDTVVVELPERGLDDTVEVFLPEAFDLRSLTVYPLGGTILPASAARPRWIAYGDSITQGWSVAEASNSWARRIARRYGLELVNLGLAGSARGETAAAMAVAEATADIVTIAWGTNAWATIPTDAEQIRHTMRTFLTTVRQGQPHVPIVVMSPIVRPKAESTPNRLGSTLSELRSALEESVREFQGASNDGRITLVLGLDLVEPDELADGLHPNDQGHGTMADRIAPYIESALALDVSAMEHS